MRALLIIAGIMIAAPIAAVILHVISTLIFYVIKKIQGIED
jgi:hypothetical protein